MGDNTNYLISLLFIKTENECILKFICHFIQKIVYYYSMYVVGIIQKCVLPKLVTSHENEGYKHTINNISFIMFDKYSHKNHE